MRYAIARHIKGEIYYAAIDMIMLVGLKELTKKFLW